MDFISNLSHNDGDQAKPVPGNPNTSDHPKKPSNSDVFHSAKVVVGAAQAHLHHEPEKYDKADLAGATADLLNAAAEYSKLDDNRGIGKYVDKAEDYLRQYNTSHHTSTGEHRPNVAVETGDGKKYSGHGGGGGDGDLMKMAGDFLKK